MNCYEQEAVLDEYKFGITISVLRETYDIDKYFIRMYPHRDSILDVHKYNEKDSVSWEEISARPPR